MAILQPRSITRRYYPMFGAYIPLIPLSCLSWAAKLGLSPTTRSILGRHAGALTDPFTIYSRDLAIAPAPEGYWMVSPFLMVNSPKSLVGQSHNPIESPYFLTNRRQRQGGSRPNSRQQQPQPATPAQQAHPEPFGIGILYWRYIPGIVSGS